MTTYLYLQCPVAETSINQVFIKSEKAKENCTGNCHEIPEFLKQSLCVLYLCIPYNVLHFTGMQKFAKRNTN